MRIIWRDLAGWQVHGEEDIFRGRVKTVKCYITSKLHECKLLVGTSWSLYMRIEDVEKRMAADDAIPRYILLRRADQLRIPVWKTTTNREILRRIRVKESLQNPRYPRKSVT